MQIFDNEVYEIVEKGLEGNGLTREETFKALQRGRNDQRGRFDSLGWPEGFQWRRPMAMLKSMLRLA